MPEPVEPEAPKVEEIPEAPKEEKKPVINARKPLSQQVDTLLSQVPAKEEKKEEEAPKPEVKEPEPSTPEPTEDKPEDIPKPELAVLPEDAGKYIYEKLPLMPVVGHIGEGADRVYQVKRREDLPAGFVYANQEAREDFRDAISIQELTARKLLEEYENTKQDNDKKTKEHEQQLQWQEARAKIDADVVADLEALQREGILQKFKYDSTDSKFSEDPAVKEADAIHKVWEDTNKKFAETRQGKFIGYREAADKYFAAKFREEMKNRIEEKSEEKKEEKKPTERERVATQVGAPSGAEAGKQHPVVRRGMTGQDIVKLVNAGKI